MPTRSWESCWPPLSYTLSLCISDPLLVGIGFVARTFRHVLGVKCSATSAAQACSRAISDEALRAAFD